MNRLADLLPGVVAQLAATHTATNGEPPMTDTTKLADALIAIIEPHTDVEMPYDASCGHEVALCTECCEVVDDDPCRPIQLIGKALGIEFGLLPPGEGAEAKACLDAVTAMRSAVA